MYEFLEVICCSRSRGGLGDDLAIADDRREIPCLRALGPADDSARMLTMQVLHTLASNDARKDSVAWTGRFLIVLHQMCLAARRDKVAFKLGLRVRWRGKFKDRMAAPPMQVERHKALAAALPLHLRPAEQ